MLIKHRETLVAVSSFLILATFGVLIIQNRFIFEDDDDKQLHDIVGDPVELDKLADDTFRLEDNDVFDELVTTNANHFSIMTFNVFKHLCKYDENTAVSFYDNEANVVDILCLQESSSSPKALKHYDLLGHCKSVDDKKSVYFRKDLVEKPQFIQCITINTRNAIIFSYRGLIIANIHLLGGRFADRDLCSKDDDIDIFVSQKMHLLESVVKQFKPDIVLGDFNSVFHSDEERYQLFLTGQQEYLSTICGAPVDMNIAEKWNMSPYIFLLQKGFQYAMPMNEHIATNIRGNTIVDTMWYNPARCIMSDIEVVDIMKLDFIHCSFSDHNPIKATVTIQGL